MALIQTKDLQKTYVDGSVRTHVLKGITLSIERGEWVAIMGRSGAGKSTLMYQMSLLDDPTGGELLIDGHDARAMNPKQKSEFRLRKFGYVFQDYALLPELTALENVMLPLLMENHSTADARAKSEAALSQVGLGTRLRNLPSQLSGGEQQRVSIARAIAERPEILFVDEPTANLDKDSSLVVMNIFKTLHAAGQTIIMVTHEPEFGAMAERTIHLDDGRIVV